MEIPNDFKEFIELLNKHSVQYLIVGGYAVGFHSRPKFTNDIDFWINNSLENAELILRVLKDFGFEKLDITIEDLISPNKIIQLGMEPMRIDIMTSVSGLEFNNSFKNKVVTNYLDTTAYFININDLIQNKRKSGRKKDLYDIDWIEQYKKQ